MRYKAYHYKANPSLPVGHYTIILTPDVDSKTKHGFYTLQVEGFNIVLVYKPIKESDE